jgi:hypothetical protein
MKVFLVAPQLENDRATEITVKWASQFNEAIGKLDDISVISFLGKHAVRIKVETALKEDEGKKGVFAFIDHGKKNKLLGADDKALIYSENFGLIKYKIIYAVACKSASNLGDIALKRKAAGYIGFTDNFHIIPDAANTFGYCFLSGLQSIIMQKSSLKEAIIKIENEIQRVIHKLKAHKGIHPITRSTIITSLRHNFNCMVCLGNTSWRIGPSLDRI